MVVDCENGGFSTARFGRVVRKRVRRRVKQTVGIAHQRVSKQVVKADPAQTGWSVCGRRLELSGLVACCADGVCEKRPPGRAARPNRSSETELRERVWAVGRSLDLG